MRNRLAISIILLGTLANGCAGVRSINRPDIKPLRHPAVFSLGSEKWEYGQLAPDARNPIAQFLGPAPLDRNGSAIGGGVAGGPAEEYLTEVWARFLEEHAAFIPAGGGPQHRFEIRELGYAAILDTASFFAMSMYQRSHNVTAFTLTVRDPGGAVVHKKTFKLYRATSDEPLPVRYAHARVDCLGEVLAYVSREDYLTKPSGGVERIFDPPAPVDRSFPETLMLWAKSDGKETKNLYDPRAVSLMYLLFFMGEDVRAEDLERMPFGATVMNRVAVIAQSLKWPLFPQGLKVKTGAVDAAGNITDF